MPESASTLTLVLIVLLPVGLLLLFVVFFMMLRMSARLSRIERMLENAQALPEDTAAKKRETQKQKEEQSEYEEFLREDGSRRMLTKREQAAAFREWRRQRGKTWGAADASDG